MARAKHLRYSLGHVRRRHQKLQQAILKTQATLTGAAHSKFQDALCEAGVCPSCAEYGGVHRESVDIGVGVQYGPWGCVCGWSESPEYDCRNGPAKADAEYESHVCDQWGMAHPVVQDPTFLNSENSDV